MPPARTGGTRSPGGGVSRVDRRIARLDTVERRLWLVVALALVADVGVTYAGLRLGFVEANPVLVTAMEAVGPPALGLVKAGAVGIGGAYRQLRPEYGGAIALGLALPWLAAAAVNTVQIVPVLLG